MEKPRLDSIRIKVNNPCQWTCVFCHNEGTELPTGGNANLRVSAFLDPGVQSYPHVEDLKLNEAALKGFDTLRSLGIAEAHLTGGEPTLHPQLPTVVSELTDRGFVVKLTSNGQSAPHKMRELKEAGLQGITFSILSLDPAEFLKTQNYPKIPGLDPLVWAERMIKREKENILLARSLGMATKINTAVLGEEDYPRVDTVFEFARASRIDLVILPSIGDKEDSQPAVFDYASRRATYQRDVAPDLTSNASRIFLTDDGVELRAKYLTASHPEVVCSGCEHNGKPSCVEKFYGLRMEFRGGEPYIRLCLQKTNPSTVMSLQEFVDRDLINDLNGRHRQ